jgi:uncharacterized protein
MPIFFIPIIIYNVAMWQTLSRFRRIVPALLMIFIFFGCATYYQKNIRFQKYLTQGEINKADEWLEKDSKDKDKKKNLTLYNLHRGYVSWMLREHEQSNRYFFSAEQIIEDRIKNLGNEVLALMTNPAIKPYRPEDFETVMINYFTALNFLQTRQFDEALVECRKINIKLNTLNDKYKDHKNRYQRDAFAHLIMGMIYEARKDHNNAFIAYRNAYEIYSEDYSKYFNMQVPEQLKHDLLRAAYNTGFFEELRFYEKQFTIKYKPDNQNNPELVFFWFTGFGPVKSEWSINLTTVSDDKGMITFANEQHNLSFPYYIGDYSASKRSSLKDLRFLRIAFPKFAERLPVYREAEIVCNQKAYKLEEAQNINEIAFKTLHDRMLREFANSLLRMATKKAIEKAVSSQDQGLGAAVSITNALTEKADTRNWQTLPYAIHYTRIPMKEGKNNIKLSIGSGSGPTQEFTFDAQKGNTYFHAFHSIETYPPKL